MVALITGASKGIGRSTAIKFAKEGYDVIINYNSDLEGIEQTKKECLKFCENVLVIKADVSNETDINNMMKEISCHYNSVDCIVNNAGIAFDTFPFEKTKEDINRVLDVNLVGPYLVVKAAKELMKTGSIINVSSNNALDNYYPESLDYDASKAGLISLTHNLAVALSPNIRVNAVCPGWIETDMNKDLDGDFRDKQIKRILEKRFGKPEEVADVICFLASEEASYINNSVIRIDGGINGSC